MNTERKTDRVRGVIITAIRDLARRGKVFTYHDLPPGAGARSLCNALVRRGELRRANRPDNGCRAEPSLYCAP